MMDRTALIGCAIAVVLWGAAGVCDKLGTKGLDPFMAVLVRLVMTTAMVLTFCIATGRMQALGSFSPRTLWWLGLSGLVGSFLGQAFFYVAIKHAPVSQVVPITAAYPVVALALAVMFLREPVTPARVAGVLLVVVGLGLVGSSVPQKAPAEAVAVEAVSPDEPTG